VDSDKDIVEPSAMVNALAKWATIGKLVPLAWWHQEEVVGNVDPSTAGINDKREVTAKGWIDQSTPRGAEAWRLVKSGTLSFSWGYLIPDGGATKRQGGRLHIKELDLFEISVVPIAPANNDTRVLSFKAAEKAPEAAEDQNTELQEVKARLETLEKALEDLTKKAEETDKEPETAGSVDTLRRQADDVELKFASGGLSLEKPPAPVKPKPREDLVDIEVLKQRMRDDMLIHLNGDIE
jgi:HK97 family phage prohead protease